MTCIENPQEGVIGPQPIVKIPNIPTGSFSSHPSGPGQAARVFTDQQQALRRSSGVISGFGTQQLMCIYPPVYLWA